MKIVLAYSGGLDTSVAIVWLKEKYDAEIVGFCSDVGQGEDLEAARKKALRTGAVSCHVLDQRDEFVRDFVFPAVRAAAVYEGAYYLGTALARPCIARGMMEVAAREGATAIAHGSTGKGNDQVRFELGAYWFNPSIRIIAPWREWEFKSRSELLAFAAAKKIPVEATAAKPYSIDRNLLHTSYEGGILEDPDVEPPAEMFQRTADPRRAPDEPREVAIAFEKGTPVAVDGKPLGPAALLAELNTLAGRARRRPRRRGRGPLRRHEEPRRLRDPGGNAPTPGAPGGGVADDGPRGDAPARQRRRSSTRRWSTGASGSRPSAKRCRNWSTPSTSPSPATARLRLYKGSATLIGRSSPRSLYRNDIVTFEDDRGAYDQRDAGGFIRLNALRLRTTAMVKDPA